VGVIRAPCPEPARSLPGACARPLEPVLGTATTAAHRGGSRARPHRACPEPALVDRPASDEARRGPVPRRLEPAEATHRHPRASGGAGSLARSVPHQNDPGYSSLSRLHPPARACSVHRTGGAGINTARHKPVARAAAGGRRTRPLRQRSGGRRRPSSTALAPSEASPRPHGRLKHLSDGWARHPRTRGLPGPSGEWPGVLAVGHLGAVSWHPAEVRGIPERHSHKFTSVRCPKTRPSQGDCSGSAARGGPPPVREGEERVVTESDPSWPDAERGGWVRRRG